MDGVRAENSQLAAVKCEARGAGRMRVCEVRRMGCISSLGSKEVEESPSASLPTNGWRRQEEIQSFIIWANLESYSLGVMFKTGPAGDGAGSLERSPNT